MNVWISARKQSFDPTTVRNGEQHSTSNREVRNSYVSSFSTFVPKCRPDVAGGTEELMACIPEKVGHSGAEGTDERVLAVAHDAWSCARDVASVEEGHDVERVTETMRVST